jgi:pimeloyl-ACP methyl ester carboxylesterase
MSTGIPVPDRQSDGWQPGEHRMVTSDGLRYHLVASGKGPVILLVAGFPQTCYAWRRVAPLLANDFTVLAVDLPGQGDSEKPVDGFDTRTTARRLNGLMKTLGHDRYVYVGHDIGAWIGYALAYEAADSLRGIGLIDGNIPGVTLPSSIEFGPGNWATFHFLFNAVRDLPEALLTSREGLYVEWFLREKTESFRKTFSQADIDEYVRAYSLPGAMRSMLGYYRAIVEDIGIHAALAKNPIQVPLLALGGDSGASPDMYERMQTLAKEVYGGVVASSAHYVPEEQPEAVADQIRQFMARFPSESA